MKPRRSCFGLSAALILAAVSPLAAQERRITLERPAEGQFVLDHAGLLSESDRARIREISGKLLKDKATPIIVVTIHSMAEHNGAGMTIDGFAMRLFNQWGIGHEALGDKYWNTGILVLVSKYDRKARIELGAGWRHDKDHVARQIMDELMVPEFRTGNYATGILAGVDALDKMARELEIPRRPRPWWHYALIVGFVGLAIFTVISLIRRGASGWAWLMWAAIFGVVGYMLYNVINQNRGSGGGFSGGSFGGGYSGGGGASGSW